MIFTLFHGVTSSTVLSDCLRRREAIREILLVASAKDIFTRTMQEGMESFGGQFISRSEFHCVEDGENTTFKVRTKVGIVAPYSNTHILTTRRGTKLWSFDYPRGLWVEDFTQEIKGYTIKPVYDPSPNWIVTGPRMEPKRVWDWKQGLQVVAAQMNMKFL